MGKFSNIVKAKNERPDNSKTVKPDERVDTEPDSSKTTKPEKQIDVEDMVNLSIKVPRRLRQKWVAESRLRGTTLTAVITEYLKSELGE